MAKVEPLISGQVPKRRTAVTRFPCFFEEVSFAWIAQRHYKKQQNRQKASLWVEARVQRPLVPCRIMQRHKEKNRRRRCSNCRSQRQDAIVKRRGLRGAVGVHLLAMLPEVRTTDALPADHVAPDVVACGHRACNRHLHIVCYVRTLGRKSQSCAKTKTCGHFCKCPWISDSENSAGVVQRQRPADIFANARGSPTAKTARESCKNKDLRTFLQVLVDLRQRKQRGAPTRAAWQFELLHKLQHEAIG